MTREGADAEARREADYYSRSCIVRPSRGVIFLVGS